MPSIANQMLEITPDDSTRTARVRVTCDVHFSEKEMEIMLQNPQRVYFKLFCWLMGQDLGPASVMNADDWLYSFPTISFPDNTPTAVEYAVFDSTLGYSLLNEDVVGSDEIYANLMLSGWRPFDDKVNATTNVVEYEFG